jgi:signal transduction histidine kinase
MSMAAPGAGPDDAEAAQWAREITLNKRPESYRLALAVAALGPSFTLLIALIQPQHLLAFAYAGAGSLLTALVHGLALRRAQSPRQVLGAHALMQGGLLLTMAFVSATTPFLGFITGFTALLVLGPIAGHTWPLRFAAAMFFPVPVVFFAANLALPSGHPPEVVLPYAVLLLFVAVVGTSQMARKHAVERGAFRSRQELAQANRELAASMQRLVRTQSELVRSEKLAVMGQLVAAVAHELNTPLGAISASADTLGQGLPSCVNDLPETISGMDPVSRDGFRNLLARVVARPPGTSTTSSREERQRRRALQVQLDAVGVPSARDRARSLAELGIIDELEPLLPLLQQPQADAVLERIESVAALLRSASTIHVAAGRASKIVHALKRYAHPGDRSGAAVRASLAESLDTITTLYGNHLKQGVTVVRDYAVPGHVEARHDALNQVWTNLVHNALQAMQGTGKLTLRVMEEGDDNVRVEIEDDGPGIPEDARPRIFEAFFTTKAAGEGSGLGLSIGKDIVEQHGGTLSVESAPGRTVFAVVLPRRPVDEG